MREHTVTTDDGRTLAVSDYGPVDGRPILVHNGTPNSRLINQPDVARASAAGIRLISYDRPGYGGSDRRPGRTVRADREEMLAAGAGEMLEILQTLLSPVDRAALDAGLVDDMIESGRAGLAPGADGWGDDSIALESPWGFDVSDIRTPVLLRHGRQDRFVPFGHGEWLAARIPGVEAHLTDDDGHLSLTARHLDHLHGWLLSR